MAELGVKPNCVKCGNPIEDQGSAYYEVIGWSHKRPSYGGTNSLWRKTPTGRWMHTGCVEKVKLGLDGEQESLNV
jgi:hypothetical protein